MVNFPSYSGYPASYYWPGNERFKPYPGVYNQNTFPMTAAYVNPFGSVPPAATAWTNPVAGPSYTPPDLRANKREFTTTLLKSGLEILVGLSVYRRGADLGIKHLAKHFGAGAEYIGGLGLSFLASGLTGGIFSGIYQIMKTRSIDMKTLLNDTLWGGLGA